MAIIKLDNVRVNVLPPDLDGDGVVGGVENVTRPLASEMIPIDPKSDITQAVKELNDDFVEAHTNMSSIDLKSRLEEIEISGVLCWDTLIWLNVLPNKALRLTRQKKRLAVSKKGEGRKEAVSVITGEREHQVRKSGFKDRLRNFIGGNKEELETKK